VSEGSEAIPAATVVLARDGADGIEVLMLRKNAKLSFGGMWVFPGGRVDAGEGEGEEGARRAAVREAREEADLVVDIDGLVAFAHWTPPAAAPKRFATWFFLAPAPSGREVTIDGGEIHEHVWVTAKVALERQAAGEIELAPPTWVSLAWLASEPDVASALATAAARPVEQFETHIGRAKDGSLLAVWHGDAGYDSGDLDALGGRHRLLMGKGAWVYERSS
jgi:8-oxo-dGTP pyrophosphatase MutT (NUDIX family)